MKALVRGLVQLVFPPRCGVCLAFGPEVLCALCRDAIERLQPPWCARCGAPTGLPHAEVFCRQPALIDTARSFGRYRSVLADAINALKFRGRRVLGPALGALLAEFVTRDDGPPPTPRALTAVDAVCPVPLHHRRLAARGFNQVDALARAVGAACTVPVEPLLRRIRPTDFQRTLTPRARLGNVRGAFARASGVSVQGARILLVDDLMTTGATLAECARVLRRGGAHTVVALTLARAGYGDDDNGASALPHLAGGVL